MRCYEFYSSLPPELVFARLEGRTKPFSTFALGDSTFRYKRRKDSFWLAYMGDLPASGSVAFWGTVQAEASGSVISGGFSVWRALWKMLAAMGGVMCLIALMFGASPVQILTMVLPMLVLWALMCVGGFSLTQQAFFIKRQQAALDFIRQYLLE